MKRLIYCLLILAVIWNGCTDEEIVSNKSSVGKEVWMNIPFGAQDNGEVKVTTRATIGVVPESRVYNLFVYLFVDGKRVYAHYFDNENMMVTKEDAIGAEVNCWYVENQTDANGQTQGTIRAKAPSFTNGTMYIIAGKTELPSRRKRNKIIGCYLESGNYFTERLFSYVGKIRRYIGK